MTRSAVLARLRYRDFRLLWAGMSASHAGDRLHELAQAWPGAGLTGSSALGQKAPAIVMAHGFSAVKEIALPDFAERFAAVGFVMLAFDYRYFGDSEGEPRSQLFPLDQVEDVRNAITWVSGQPEVDPQRIGLWGTSYGGGVVVYTATFDRRAKAVVAQVPATVSPSRRRSLRRLHDPGRSESELAQSGDHRVAGKGARV